MTSPSLKVSSVNGTVLFCPIFPPVLSRAHPATPTKQEGQHEPCDKSADVCHVSYSTRVRCFSNGTDAAKELQNDPEPNDDQRGHLNHLLALQYSDPSLWKQQDVGAVSYTHLTLPTKRIV